MLLSHFSRPNRLYRIKNILLSCLTVFFSQNSLASEMPASIHQDAVATKWLTKSQTAIKAHTKESWRDVTMSGDFLVAAYSGKFEIKQDWLIGSNRIDYDLGVTSGVEGFDGKIGWIQDEHQIVKIKASDEERLLNNSMAYLVRHAWFPTSKKAPASIAWKGIREIGSRTFATIAAQADDMCPLELQINTVTKLLERVLVACRSKTKQIEYSEFRPSKGGILPFKIVEKDGDDDEQVYLVKSVQFSKTFIATVYEKPLSQFDDAHIRNAENRTEVRFLDQAGHIVIEASLNHQPPLRFIFDSGASNLITPAAAQNLGLVGTSEVNVEGIGEEKSVAKRGKVNSLVIGELEMTNQDFVILDLPSTLTYRYGEPSIVGLIGYEVLRRFVTHIDYDRQILVFEKPKQYQSKPQFLSFGFDDKTPIIPILIDGIASQVSFDTGNNGRLDLYGDFIRQHNLQPQVKPLENLSEAIGGALKSYITRVQSIVLAGRTLHRPIVQFTNAKAGVYANQTIAGNLGYELIRHFVFTLDYENQQFSVQRSQHFGEELPQNRAGLHTTKSANGAIFIDNIQADSEAEHVGLCVGDEVLQIDDKRAIALDFVTLWRKFRQAAGTKLNIKIDRAGEKKQFEIQLHDPIEK